MGSTEMDASEKGSKAPASQEQTPATSTATAYPDWAGFQAAYSQIPPPGFFHSPMASSPQPHPYMWGAQQLMPPYGTQPPPYVAMYPHGGLYPHPSIPPGSHPFNPYMMPSPNGNAEASGAMPCGMETNGKSAEGKDRSPLKRSKGSLGSLNMLTGKNNNDQGKISGASTNGFVSQRTPEIFSGESASEGSSEGSDTSSQNQLQHKKPCRPGSGGAEASQNRTSVSDHQNGVAHPSSHANLNQTVPIMPMPAHGAPAGVAGPATNLNIGMDYWGGPTALPMPALRGKVPAAPVGGTGVPTGLVGPRESELWPQDEREVRRQKRKQSNRESARRSRLRKQAECEELAQRVGVLKEENSCLITEVSRMREEYEKLVTENNSLKDRLGKLPRGHADSRSDGNGQPSSNDHQRHLESSTQVGQKEPA